MGTPTLGTAKCESRMEVQLEVLEERFTELQRAVTELTVRLGTILEPSKEVAGASPTAPQNVLKAEHRILSRIETACRRLEVLAITIHDLRERLDV